MFRDLLSSRAMHVGLVFFVLIVGGTQLYSWHVRRTSQEALERTKRIVQQLENKKETRTAQDVGVSTDTETLEPSEVPIISDEMPTMSEETDAFLTDDTVDVADAFLLDDKTLADEKENAEGPVSPHGFGPYPEVPDDYPVSRFSWKYTYDDPKQELLARIRIALWRQGVPVEGAVFKQRNGLIYPTIRGTVYVEWDGDFPIGILGHPDDDFERIRSTLEAGGTPAGITVLDFDEAGIDPYQFLNIQ